MNANPQDKRILGLYESLGRLSRTMLVAAQSSDWESLQAAERISALLIERLEAYGDAASMLCPEDRQRRMSILRGVLIDDAAIRRHTEPSLTVLDKLLGPTPRRGRGG
jgi:hypothetical protein